MSEDQAFTKWVELNSDPTARAELSAELFSRLAAGNGYPDNVVVPSEVRALKRAISTAVMYRLTPDTVAIWRANLGLAIKYHQWRYGGAGAAAALEV